MARGARRLKDETARCTYSAGAAPSAHSGSEPAAAAPSRPYTGIDGGRDASTSCAAAMPAPPRRFPPPSTAEEDASIERWSCAGQSSRSSFRLSAWQRARRKLSRARVIIFVRSAPSRTASGHARSSAPGSRSCRKRQRRWTSRRRAPLRHYRRRIGRALPLPPTNCRLLPQMGSREAERCRNSPRDCARACTASR